MNPGRFLCHFLLLLPAGFFACGENTGHPVAPAAAAPIATDTTAPPARHKSLMSGKGTLSFKMDGKLYQADPTHTKCWTGANVPLAMLMATGEGLNISWQMGFNFRQDEYRIARDKDGTLNFTVDGKMYWVRNVAGKDYLNIMITGVKDKYTVKMLSGTFEGVLEDKDGHVVHITEGKFTTDDI